MLSFVLFLVTAYTASFLRIEVKYDPDRWKQWPARDDDGRDGGANTTASAEEGDWNGLADTRIERGGALSPSDAIEDKGVRAVGVDRAEEEEEQQQQTAEKTVERRYPSRTRLLFNHLPKAGGKYAINVLKEHVPWETVKIVSEFRKSTETDRKTHFIIANIREVCSYYMSLFHYGVQYGGNLKNQFEFMVFPKNPELRNIYRDENDVENFHKWLRVIKVRYCIPSRAPLSSLPARWSHFSTRCIRSKCSRWRKHRLVDDSMRARVKPRDAFRILFT